MRYLVMLLFVLSVGFSQQKEQRYTIEKIGTVDELELVILLDSQTGKCWQLLSDSVVVEKSTGKIEQQKFYVWKPLLFSPKTNVVAPRYKIEPEEIEITKK